MNKQEISMEYLQVKSDIKAHLTLVQVLMNHIQTSRNELETLNTRSKELHKQLEELADDGKKTEQE